MKVGKEELAGIYAAVKLLMEQDETREYARREQQLDHILSCIQDVHDVSSRRLGSTKAMITFDTGIYGLTPAAACRWLLDAAPSVYLEPAAEGLIVSTECLDVGDEKPVGNQLRSLFRERR